MDSYQLTKHGTVKMDPTERMMIDIEKAVRVHSGDERLVREIGNVVEKFLEGWGPIR